MQRQTNKSWTFFELFKCHKLNRFLYDTGAQLHSMPIASHIPSRIERPFTLALTIKSFTAFSVRFQRLTNSLRPISKTIVFSIPRCGGIGCWLPMRKTENICMPFYCVCVCVFFFAKSIGPRCLCWNHFSAWKTQNNFVREKFQRKKKNQFTFTCATLKKLRIDFDWKAVVPVYMWTTLA